MSGVEYATRDELDAVRRDLVNTERLLRDRDDTKQAELRAEFIQAIEASDARHDVRFDKIDETLDHQNEMMEKKEQEELEKEEQKEQIWPSWRRMVLLYITASVLTALVLAILAHFHIG